MIFFYIKIVYISIIFYILNIFYLLIKYNKNLINQKTLRLILFRLFFSHHLQIRIE